MTAFLKHKSDHENWFPTAYRIKANLPRMVYKILHNQAPICFSPIFLHCSMSPNSHHTELSAIHTMCYTFCAPMALYIPFVLNVLSITLILLGEFSIHFSIISVGFIGSVISLLTNSPLCRAPYHPLNPIPDYSRALIKLVVLVVAPDT